MTVDRLSALDQSFLRIETESAHMHIGWTMFLEGTPPSEQELHAHIGARLGRLPRFRRRVLSSAVGLHDPIWVDDQDFDLSRHVVRVRVPPPGGPAAARRLVGELLSVPLERSHPLWRIHLLAGLEGNRFALVGQVHHALVDGISALEMVQLLLDATPLSLPVAPRPFTPEPAPGFLNRTLATAGERLSLTRSAGTFALRSLADPSILTDKAAQLRRLGSAIATAGAPAPATSLNRPIGRQRSVGFARVSLDLAKELGRRHDATVNDVILSVASLALGRYLRRCGESLPWLRVLVPVSTRDNGHASAGNQVSAVLVELPTGERDPRATLEEVSRQSREHKRAADAGAVDSLLRASRLAPAPLRDAAVWLAMRPQTFNAILSNLRGPSAPLFLLGRRMEAVYPAVPLVQGHGVSIGAVSYCGSLHLGLYADPEVVPELTDLAHDLTSAFDALRVALEPRGRPRSPRGRPRPRTRGGRRGTAARSVVAPA
jgi:diacylglycerol O-acyltransferase / wax synthase